MPVRLALSAEHCRSLSLPISEPVTGILEAPLATANISEQPSQSKQSTQTFEVKATCRSLSVDEIIDYGGAALMTRLNDVERCFFD